jgi:hypothetical protein
MWLAVVLAARSVFGAAASLADEEKPQTHVVQWLVLGPMDSPFPAGG